MREQENRVSGGFAGTRITGAVKGISRKGGTKLHRGLRKAIRIVFGGAWVGGGGVFGYLKRGRSTVQDSGEPDRGGVRVAVVYRPTECWSAMCISCSPNLRSKGEGENG